MMGKEVIIYYLGMYNSFCVLDVVVLIGVIVISINQVVVKMVWVGFLVIEGKVW